MEVLYPRCCGIDMHQSFVVACLSMVENGQRHKEVRRLNTQKGDLMALRDWLLVQHQVEQGRDQAATAWEG